MTLIAFVMSPGSADTARWAVALAIPLIVGVVAKSTASSGLKAVINTVISAAATGLFALFDARGAGFGVLLREFIQTVVISGATYQHVWVPTGIVGSIQAKTPNFGFGSPPVLETPDAPEQVAAPAPVPVKKAAKKAPAKKDGG